MRPDRAALVLEHRPVAILIAKRIARDWSSVDSTLEEVVNDAMLALCILAEEYEPKPGGQSFKSFLHSRLRFRIIDLIRERARGVHQLKAEFHREILPESAFGEDTLINLAGAEEDPSYEAIIIWETLCQATAKFPERTRNMVLMRAAGMPLAEVARHYGVHESRVSQIVHEAGGRIRYLL